MRARLLRRLLLRDHHPQPSPAPNPTTSIRPFTYNANALTITRPQLPFLAITSRTRRDQWRYMSTARIKYELGLAIKFTAYIWAAVAVFVVAGFAYQQEFFEQLYPTPREWTWRSRWLKRSTDAERMRYEVFMDNWVMTVQLLANLLQRLEDPTKDGKGLKDAVGGPPGTKDISDMPEPWRRGYFEAFLLCAQASEHTENYVVDKTRNIAFPADTMKGPSNPFPKPVPPRSPASPREENCVPSGYPDPAVMYPKLLATEGLTNRQRIQAALSYANWLEFKGLLAPAAVMYEEALSRSVEEIQTPGAPPVLDPKTSVLNDKAARKPSANLLESLTALATFKARHDDVSAALPILVSVLQARRSLPPPAAPARESIEISLHQSTASRNFVDKLRDFITPPPYPPPPPDGTAPPVRDSAELCAEAALHVHIGEILYTMQSSTREDGLAWTREGIDLAEEELHKVVGARVDDFEARATKKICRQCLSTGMDNWRTMVDRMVQREKEARAKTQQPSAGWFGGLWKGSKIEEEDGGRWVAEEKVIDERTRRAQELLEEIPVPPTSIFSGAVRA